MISLRPITPKEFPAYRQVFIEDYGRELVENDGLEPEEGRRRAAADVDETFPGAEVPPGHRLWCLEEPRQPAVVGYLWVKTLPECLFVMDFFVYPEHRGRGHGRSALAALDEVARQEGRTLRLRVARTNTKALALYQQAGYHITGYNLAKG